MSTVFDRLGFNFDSTKFGSVNELTDGQKLTLANNNTLETWQINDLANNTVTGYFQNPHTTNLAALSILANTIMSISIANSTNEYSSTNTQNLLFSSANTLSLEIPIFSSHVDRMSGVSPSSNKLTIPDYSAAMAVGRQMLTIVNQSDNIQNNSPILGNFTSVFIGDDIDNSVVTLTNNLNTLNTAFILYNYVAPANTVSAQNSQDSYVVKNDGTLWGWGRNQIGQLGLNDRTNRSSPVQIGTASDWIQVSCGYNYALALKSNNSLYAFGNNNHGELGLNDQVARSNPTLVTLPPVFFKDVSAHFQHTLALGNNFTLWGWGANSFGQLGLGDRTNRSSPSQIGTLSSWSKIRCGAQQSFAIQSNGTLWSWGRNDFGELGTSNLTQRSSPVQVGTESYWIEVAAGGNHTLAVANNGTLWSWGYNFSGQLGNNSKSNFLSPIQVGTESNWLKIGATGEQSFAIKTNGTLWAWGSNNGRLPLGDTTPRSTPVQVGTESNWYLVSPGQNHSISVKNDGTVWVWGNNSFGQLGIKGYPLNTVTLVPIKTGDYIRIDTANSTINTFISNIQSTYNLLSQRRQADVNFYTNSLSLLNDYQTLVQFNNLGVTSQYLIDNYIGTDKLKSNLSS